VTVTFSNAGKAAVALTLVDRYSGQSQTLSLAAAACSR
jgi:hypothetical protein